MIKINLLILIICLSSLAHCADQGDWVDVYNFSLNFTVQPFYAGYLQISEQQKFYYVHFPSEKNPTKDPLIIRVSGGPGCSSLYSFMYSKGPFVFTPNTSTFRFNNYNWNKEANVLFIEGPAGVGFAKGETQNMTDSLFAQLNILALFKFYEKFPQYKDNDVYLSGQIYSGVSVPDMAQLIVAHNNNPYTPAWQRIMFKGFILENPCTLGDQCDSHFEYSRYQMQYLQRHYFISREKYEEYYSKCTFHTPACEQIRIQIEDHFSKTGSDIRNPYKECFKQTGVPEYYKCLDLIGALSFLGNLHVKQDMHADPEIQWQFCNFTIMEQYQRDPEGSYQIYQKLLRQEKDLRIWIVSGALSALVPIVGTRKWIQDLKVNLKLEITRPWESWKYDEDINAGQIQQMTKLTFITVRSAGAHLYNDQPEIGYHIIDSFLKGIPL